MAGVAIGLPFGNFDGIFRGVAAQFVSHSNLGGYRQRFA
jgi:hypothetical protein